ncbi:MAG: hypothetical protein R6V57_01070 [Vicinamibacterales bacterium]
MMRRLAAVAVAVGLIGAVQVGAWGGEGHRLILDRAIQLLPPELRAAFETDRAMLLGHASDPDLWRIAGFDDEAPRHFLDIDAYGPPPFSALPRDLGAAIEKFGPETITRNGLLPWRAAEMRGRLLRAFEAHKSDQRYGRSNAVYLAAVLAHYVADAHQPFHAVLNYDGQLTNQHGIHARFEDELPARFGARLTYAPSAPQPILDTRGAMFDALVSGAALAAGLLEADRRAAEGRTEYDDAYYEALVRVVQPVFERRASEAITAVAGVILGAWEEAGRPDLAKTLPRPVQKIRGRDAR